MRVDRCEKRKRQKAGNREKGQKREGESREMKDDRK